MKVAVASVLRERRSRARGASQASAKQDDGEAEAIALLYGDASRRKRSFDTQPSHIRPAKAMPVSPGSELRVENRRLLEEVHRLRAHVGR